jgi:hypothetical protein
MNTQNIRQQLDSIQSQLDPMLDDYKKNYVLYNKEPDNEEYESYYETSVTNIEQLKNKLFDIKNQIETNNSKLSSNLDTINTKINNSRQKNTKLRSGLDYTENEYNTSEEMIDNYVEIYNLTYLKNFSLLIGVLGLGFFMTKHFSQP